MPSLKKNTIAQTFKFDCDRYLRFSLASPTDRKAAGVKIIPDYRPGIDLVKAAGARWEAEKFQDLVDVLPAESVSYNLDQEIDERIGRQRFLKVENIYELLSQPSPPEVIIEGEFPVPTSITPALEEAYRRYNLDPVSARPDIMWVRRHPTGAPLLGKRDSPPECEIHIIDVKLAAEPSLRHFTEVTYYALALAAFLKKKGLSNRYAVSAQGFVWPGSYDNNAFRNLHKEFVARGSSDPVSQALAKTLVAVPYEVYQVHVTQFFEDRLLRVLEQPMEEAAWHVSPKCQLCEFLPHCEEQAQVTDHLSRIAWMTSGQARLLRDNDIYTTEQLAGAIANKTPDWEAVVKTSHQLKSETAVLRARADSLQQEQPIAVQGRVTILMPKWADVNIFLTVHFDMGSGITFAMGAKRVAFTPGSPRGTRLEEETHTFIVDNISGLNTDPEKKRFMEFTELITGWLQSASDYNAAHHKDDQVSVHIFFWDGLEVKQLGRMFRRHISDAEVAEKTELLLRFFPPDDILPDPDVFKSQPGTIVKEVFRTMFGLPIPHDYTLFDVANVFHPFIKDDGEAFTYGAPFGFKYPMTDQIPFERAYELWQDNIYLTHYSPHLPKHKWPKYTRGEIRDGIKKTVETRLNALQHVVRALQENYKDSLVLRKSKFRAASPTQTKIPEKARNLVAFSKLNAVVAEMNNRQDRALPVEEREARFISIRGLLPAQGQQYDQAINSLRDERLDYLFRDIIPLTFSPESRDCRIKEGDWLLAVSNEDAEFDLSIPWYKNLEINFDDGERLLEAHGITAKKWVRAALSKLLRVEVASLQTAADPPFLLMAPADAQVFRFAQAVGLLDMNRPMVIDPVYEDFSTDRIVEALTLVGGEYPVIKRRKK